MLHFLFQTVPLWVVPVGTEAGECRPGSRFQLRRTGNKKGLVFKPRATKSRYSFGMLEGVRKNGHLDPKRHQMKHLGFAPFGFRDQGSEVRILSPRPLNPAISIN